MGFFNKIISSIFGHGSTPQADTPATPTAPGTPGGITPAVAPAAAPVDVDAVLSAMAAKNPEHLDWKKSIVDLLKILNIDSSVAARKELAAELHFPGDTGDSASMNLWLHKEVLRKLAANGGVVPADLLD